MRIGTEGAGLPEKIADGLELVEPWMDFYLNAFFELSTERRGPGLPIPWGRIDRYAERYGIEGPDFSQFKDLLREMDALYLNNRDKDIGAPGQIPTQPSKTR